jgi:hypothetical protein
MDEFSALWRRRTIAVIVKDERQISENPSRVAVPFRKIVEKGIGPKPMTQYGNSVRESSVKHNRERKAVCNRLKHPIDREFGFDCRKCTVSRKSTDNRNGQGRRCVRRELRKYLIGLGRDEHATLEKMGKNEPRWRTRHSPQICDVYDRSN